MILFMFMISCVPDGSFYRDSWRKGWFYNKDDRNRIIKTAQRYLGVRYKLGGASPQGFDCSGYVMYVYRQNGVLLPRSVEGQFGSGKKVMFRQARPGDLVFFKTSRKRKLSHVGIYIGNNQFIHSPRTGKRVSFANINGPYWKKRYRGAVTFMRGDRI